MLILNLRSAQKERLVITHGGEEMLITVAAAESGYRLRVEIDAPLSFDVRREKGGAVGDVSEVSGHGGGG